MRLGRLTAGRTRAVAAGQRLRGVGMGVVVCPGTAKGVEGMNDRSVEAKGRWLRVVALQDRQTNGRCRVKRRRWVESEMSKSHALTTALCLLNPGSALCCCLRVLAKLLHLFTIWWWNISPYSDVKYDNTMITMGIRDVSSSLNFYGLHGLTTQLLLLVCLCNIL